MLFLLFYFVFLFVEIYKKSCYNVKNCLSEKTMVDILMFSACALFGIAVASVLAGLNKKPFGWIINMFSSALLTTGGFVCAAFVYTKLSHKELSFSSLFPDRVSLFIGMFFFIILSVIVGCFVGAVSGGGIN